MRDHLPRLIAPDHLGLAYEAYAPVGDDGKVADCQRVSWLTTLENIEVAHDYAQHYRRWKSSFTVPGDRVFELTLASRLLVGHGNPSETDVGITVHHTWGVPMIPGSALKGLTAHFVDTSYGPTDPRLLPWDQVGVERTRSSYQGVTWADRQIEFGPGAVYRSLFGAPDAQRDEEFVDHGLAAGATAGLVTFHDAVYVPNSSTQNRPYVADVLTVHQKAYYDSSGDSWPNDYDSPNPVSFLSARPGARLLFALSGPSDWTELAEHLLRSALESWGVGGKTSSGYGRLVLSPTALAGPPPKTGEVVEATLLEERTKRGGWRVRHDASGLTGPIQNSDDVAATAKPGDRLMLRVASANAREVAFRIPTVNL